MALAIETRNLRKSYGDLDALCGVTLEVEDGEFFGLLGPNGAGKTTFINVLVGLARRSSGEARVFGHDVEVEYREVRNAVGLAPQEFNVDRFFPAREVLMHKAGYHGVSKTEAARRADEALEMVGLWEKRGVRFDFLSGGMKRRLLLARAMVTDPDLLILDEPTAGVDVRLRHELWKIITRLNDDGTTVLLTTHYIEEAERLCDRVCILDRGERVEVASPDELRARGTDTAYIRLRDRPDRPPDLDDSRIESVGLDGDGVVVRASRAGRVLPGVLHDLDAAGHVVVDVELVRASLEDVFVELTGEGR